MINFMVIALPRSATTWAANWLTTDTTLCLHDPLWERHYEDFDKIISDKLLGISCTGMASFPDWVNSHTAKKVILHRNLDEVNESLESIGLPAMSKEAESWLGQIQGHHYDWRDLFNNPKEIYEFLLEKPFDAERHAELMKIEMQPAFAGLTINKEVTANLISQIRSASCGE